jgi:hypothetical protein
VLYAAGLLVTALVFSLVNGSSNDFSGADYVPYYVGFGLVLGVSLGWWWLVVFPFLQWYLVEPIRLWLTSSGGPIRYVFDRPGTVLAATAAIAVGVALRQLSKRIRLLARGAP